VPVTSVSPTIAESTFYGDDVEVLTPTSYDEVAEILRDQKERGRTVIPSGLGQHAYHGNRIDGSAIVLSLREFKGILRYEPGDFTVGAQAGIPFDEFRAELASHGQEIPVDVPANDRGSTLGGATATNIFGPRSGLYGTFRNFVIGAVAMRGDGTLYKTGGMVVKNVAGYDISKILLGSLGSLGVILEVNFKLRPIRQQRSAAMVTFSLASEAWDFVRRLRHQHVDPVALSVLSPEATNTLSQKLFDHGDENWSVFWLFEGNHGTVSSLELATNAILDDNTPFNKRLPLEDDGIHTALDHLVGLQVPDDPSSQELMILRLSTLPTTADQLTYRLHDVLDSVADVQSEGTVAHGANGVLIVRARGPVDALAQCTERLSTILGELDANGRVLFACPELKARQTYLLGADPNVKIVRAIQQVFDPHAFFHTNRISMSSTP
jgi:hypothetical protein